ncbi:MAG: ABC transporter permease [Lutisporaceae bacterium]
MNFVRVLKAEVIKQHRYLFQSKFVYFTLLLWPILSFVNEFYVFKPFDLKGSAIIIDGLNATQSLLIFLLTGYVGYLCFWSMVQSAWEMSDERSNGTLETIFQSPVNRQALIYGRALGAIFENTWMFIIFSIFMYSFFYSNLANLIAFLPIVFIILIISATIWGGFMNAIFLFSRDATFLFYVFNNPMSLFSGTRIPVTVFPIWAKVISTIFPLTHVLVIIRSIFYQGKLNINLIDWTSLTVSLLIIGALTAVIIKKAEKNARINGSWTFY